MTTYFHGGVRRLRVGGRILPPDQTGARLTDLDQVQDRLTDFEKHYNQTARPFKGKFTPADLEDLLARIERHIQKERTNEHDHHPAAPAAA